MKQLTDFLDISIKLGELALVGLMLRFSWKMYILFFGELPGVK